MYLSSVLRVDPSKQTLIEAIKPTKAFNKFLHALTAGLTSKKEEIETFTAVSILQRINLCFRSMGINDIVRLSKDEIDFYLDTEGKKDDLQEALDQFDLKTHGVESEMFGTLTLVLEHMDETLKYLIQIDIKRKHPVGEYPIKIMVNAVGNQLQKNGLHGTG